MAFPDELGFAIQALAAEAKNLAVYNKYGTPGEGCAFADTYYPLITTAILLCRTNCIAYTDNIISGLKTKNQKICASAGINITDIGAQMEAYHAASEDIIAGGWYQHVIDHFDVMLGWAGGTKDCTAVILPALQHILSDLGVQATNIASTEGFWDSMIGYVDTANEYLELAGNFLGCASAVTDWALSPALVDIMGKSNPSANDAKDKIKDMMQVVSDGKTAADDFTTILSDIRSEVDAQVGLVSQITNLAGSVTTSWGLINNPDSVSTPAFP